MLVYTMQYQLRTIVSSKSTLNKVPKKVMGLTVPNEVAVFFEGCHFSVSRSGASIVFYSGTSLIPTKSDIHNYNYQDVKI